MNLEHTKDCYQRYGLGAAFQDLAYRAAKRGTELRVLHGLVLTMDSVAQDNLVATTTQRWGFVERDELVRCFSSARKDLDTAFLSQALDKGDRCFGAFEGDTLVSYGWYSTQPTAVDDRLELSFDSAYAYMYKGFTVPSHRGQRLHGIGMAKALEAYAREGKKGLVSYVEATNFASLKSCERLGYREFGKVACMRVGGRTVIRATRGCAAYRFELLERAAALPVILGARASSADARDEAAARDRGAA
jgi:hypothetical protein